MNDGIIFWANLQTKKILSVTIANCKNYGIY